LPPRCGGGGGGAAEKRKRQAEFSAQGHVYNSEKKWHKYLFNERQ
jgi:hypothetical protein